MFSINKVTSLPATLDADALYFVLGAPDDTNIEAYITNASGSAKGIGNTAFITAVATAVFNTQNQSANAFEIVGSIALRDSAAVTFGGNRLVLVTDASADPNVGSGSALYAFDDADSSFEKLTEFEALDVALTWASITDGPSSTPAQVDAAVAATSTNATAIGVNLAATTANAAATAAAALLATHDNRAEIDKVGETADSVPTYNGSEIFTSGNNDW